MSRECKGFFSCLCRAFCWFVWFDFLRNRKEAWCQEKVRKCTEVSIHKDTQFFNTGGKILVTKIDCPRGDSTDKAWADSIGLPAESPSHLRPPESFPLEASLVLNT